MNPHLVILAIFATVSIQSRFVQAKVDPTTKNQYDIVITRLSNLCVKDQEVAAYQKLVSESYAKLLLNNSPQSQAVFRSTLQIARDFIVQKCPDSDFAKVEKSIRKVFSDLGNCPKTPEHLSLVQRLIFFTEEYYTEETKETLEGLQKAVAEAQAHINTNCGNKETTTPKEKVTTTAAPDNSAEKFIWSAPLLILSTIVALSSLAIN